MTRSPQDRTAPSLRYSLLLEEVGRMCSAGPAPTVALILIQLSGLDGINGRFGYRGGDMVLEEFTRRLEGIARRQDRIVAVNGRTVALLIRDPLHAGHAMLAASKVARATTDPVEVGGGRARLRARMGISLLPEPARSAEELLRQCEIALDVARARDEPHVLFEPSLVGAAEGGSSYTWFDIDEALKAGEFELFYQPQVDLASGRMVGAEALVRWHRPQGGYVSPGHFMPAIEHSQGIRALLWYVLNSALRQAAGWAELRPGFGVAVNLAAGNLADPDLVDLVENALNVWSLPPARLTLELTESSLMQNPEASARTMGQLRGLGTRTSIDDFGTGYSSLSYLRDLPADELKIDRAFVSRIADARRDHDIVASIVQLAHAVNLKVVAEGIEQPGTLAHLAAMGCDLGQGYHFGAPVPARDFEDTWLNAGGAKASA